MISPTDINQIQTFSRQTGRRILFVCQSMTSQLELDNQTLVKNAIDAEKDGEIDQNEIRVLKNIISHIQPSEIDDAMKLKLEEISKKLIDNRIKTW